MNASANPSAVLSAGDGVRGTGLMRQTSAKPQQRFPDVPVLAGFKGQTKPDKGIAGKTSVPIGPESPQGAPETHKRSHRVVPDGKAPTGIGLPDQPAVLLVQPRSNIVKTDSSTKPLPKHAARKTEDGGQGTKDTGQKELSSPTSAPGDFEARISATTPGNTRPPSAELPDCGLNQAASPDPQSPHPGLRSGAEIRNPKWISATIPMTGNRAAVRPDQAQAEVSQPAAAGIGRQALPQPQTEGKANATVSAEIEPTNLEPKGQPVPAGESAEKPQRTWAGGNETPAHAGAKVPFTPAPVPADRPSVTITNPDRAPSMAPLANREMAAQASQAPQAPRQGAAALRTEGPRTTRRREDMPAARNRPLEVNDSGDKKIPSLQRKEGAAVQTEPPAALAGQPVVAAPRLSLEAQMPKVAEVGATANPLRSVGEQILDSVRASMTPGDRQIVIRLQPPELGTIAVRLREQGDHLEGTIEVGKSDVRREIEQALPDVVRGLQEAGVPIRRFDVTSSDSTGPDRGRGLPQQDLGAGQQGSGQHREPFPHAHTAWPQETTRYSASAEEPTGAGGQSSAPPGRIDMLL